MMCCFMIFGMLVGWFIRLDCLFLVRYNVRYLFAPLVCLVFCYSSPRRTISYATCWWVEHFDHTFDLDDL